MTTVDSSKLRSIGRQLGEYVQSQASSHVSPMALQGVVADLSAGMPDLQAPLRDLVSRQSFAALLVHARSGGGAIQRDALIQEISRVYHPDVLVQVEEVLNGFLDGSGGIASSLSQSILIGLSSPTPQISQQTEERDDEANVLDCPPHDHPSPQPRADQQQKQRGHARTSVTSFHILLLFAFFFGIPFAIMILEDWSTTSQDPISTLKSTETEKPVNDKIPKLNERISRYQTDLGDARLVCELDSIANRFKSLAVDASKFNAPEIKAQADQGQKTALARIAQLKQPGKEEYWEDCSIGVGYQKYDKYTWEYGSSYRGSYFAVAKKNCAKPALKVEMATDSNMSNKIFSEWIPFAPNALTGIAPNVPFTISASKLPTKDGSLVYGRVSDVSCNHSA